METKYPGTARTESLFSATSPSVVRPGRRAGRWGDNGHLVFRRVWFYLAYVFSDGAWSVA